MLTTQPTLDDIWQLFRETDRKFQETAQRFRETDRKLHELGELFTGQWGKLMEALIRP
ncbi:hypothetical protein CCP3SC1_60063 [Gammaproteobacteria bacterium]